MKLTFSPLLPVRSVLIVLSIGIFAFILNVACHAQQDEFAPIEEIDLVASSVPLSDATPANQGDAKVQTATNNGTKIDESGDESRNHHLFDAYLSLTSDHPITGTTALTILAIGSIVVDRISTGTLWMLSLSDVWDRSFPNPSTLEKPRDQNWAQAKLIAIYYAIATLVTMILLSFFCDLELLGAIGFEPVDQSDLFLSRTIDRYISGAIIIIGAERVAQWLQLPGTPAAAAAALQPMVISGNLTLHDPASSVAVPAEATASPKE